MIPSPSTVALWERALQLIPGGTNTISKRVTTFLDAEHFPAYAVRGRGAHVYDRDGRRYLDYIAALGAVLLGYAQERIDDRVARQLRDGFLFSLPHPCEVELAEALTVAIPCAEQVRLFKTGAEATSAAIRAARMATGRELILSGAYHGWHDWWAVTKTPAGIPAVQRDLIVEFPFNDPAAFAELIGHHGSRAAAIILTPAAYGVAPQPGYLETIRATATLLGIPLIFDEIITGFRWALGGAQEKFGVTPDLACVGKAMANGMPISAVVGRRRLMDPMQSSWISSTHASEALSIVAALETLAILREGGVYERLYAHAARLTDGLAAIGRTHGVPLTLGAVAPAIRCDFDVAPAERAGLVRRFVAACAERGVLVRRDGAGISLCLLAALTDADLDESLEVFRDALRVSL